MVYVLDKDGHPLIPTNRHGKVRRMLKSGQVKVVKKCPFTIQLMYESEHNVQPVSLGIDAGSKHIGVSATTKTTVLYEADVELRDDIVKLLATRRQKLNTHLVTVARVCEILPVTQIIVETASFDIQKIKNPKIQGVEYQRGEQTDFWNVREYVLFRDGHVCQCCKGKKKDPILNVHHIESRKSGGDAPNNLITLCKTCHKGYHNGTIKLPKRIKRGMKFKDAAFMGIMRWTFYNTLKEKYEPDIPVSMTYGYLTKNTRIQHNLPKEHYIDARCISGNPDAKSDGVYYYQKKIRCHNRQIHKFNTLRKGVRKLNQSEYLLKGYRIFDKVRYQGKEYFVFGRRKTGFFDIRTLSGEKANNGSLSIKKIAFVDTRKNYITERRTV